jgi:hypothetical protein
MPDSKEAAWRRIVEAMESIRRDPLELERVIAEPWIGDAKAAYERAKRRLQIEHHTRIIQPVNARGVGYRLLNQRPRLIDSKKNFRKVVWLVGEMRKEGTLPWEWIVEEGRELWVPGGHDDIADFLSDASAGYYRRAWDDADVQVIVAVEKAGQYGVYLPVCQEFDVPLLACEGFTSHTRKHDLGEMVAADSRPTVFLNLGDHDRSGIEAMRDLTNWSQHYGNQLIDTQRIAVLPEHVDQYDIEPRMIDKESIIHANAERRLEEITLLNESPVYDESLGNFDLDALDPNVGRDLLREALSAYLPLDRLAAIRRREKRERRKLDKLARNWPEVERFLRTLK